MAPKAPQCPANFVRCWPGSDERHPPARHIKVALKRRAASRCARPSPFLMGPTVAGEAALQEVLQKSS
eukprot:scaffold96103_cov98-Phaeocystis_antarctica.AAC.2